MSPLAKVFVVLNLVLSICFLGVTGTLFQARKHYKVEINKYASQFKKNAETWNARAEVLLGLNDDLEKTIAGLETNRDVLQVKAKNFEDQLKDKKLELARIQGDLDTARQANDKKDGYLQQKDGEIESLRSKNDELVQRTKAAEEKHKDAQLVASRIQLDNGQLAQQLADANTLNASLNAERNELKSTMEAVKAINPDIVARVLLDEPAPDIDGQVVAIEDDIVVLSVGENDAVAKGYKFTVYRQGQFLGKVEVTKVTSDLAGARILFLDDKGSSIKVGDSVTTHLN